MPDARTRARWSDASLAVFAIVMGGGCLAAPRPPAVDPRDDRLGVALESHRHTGCLRAELLVGRLRATGKRAHAFAAIESGVTGDVDLEASVRCQNAVAGRDVMWTVEWSWTVKRSGRAVARGRSTVVSEVGFFRAHMWDDWAKMTLATLDAVLAGREQVGDWHGHGMGASSWERIDD